MKRQFVFVLTCLFLVSCSTGIKKAEMENGGPIAEFKLPEYKTEVLPNGLKIIIVENHTLPAISFGLLVKSGSSYDPMAKSGAMALMATVMEKGTRKMTAPQIADELGQLGTEFQQSLNEDNSWFQLTGLSFHQKRLLDIFSDIILGANFPKDEVDREKKRVVAALAKLIDYPDRFASDAFDSFLFGSHPYSRPVSGIQRDVKGLTRKDLESLFQQVVRPNNSILVVTGDLSPELKIKIKSVFSNWQRKDIPPPIMQAPSPIRGIQLRLVEKADLNQSQVLMGNISIKRSDEDYLKLRLANLALGGGMTSRLMDEIRVNRGFTYGISSQVDARLDRGPFLIGTSTRLETTGPLITEALNVYKNFTESGITQEELDIARNSLLGQFPKAIETSPKLGYNLAVLDFYGLKDDYLRNFTKNLQSITLSQVNEAVRRHFSGDMKILVLGPPSLIEVLRPFGPVEVRQPNQIF